MSDNFKIPNQILSEALNRFNELTNEQFERFLAVTEFQEYRKNDYLLQYGNYHNGLYFVIDGTVGLFELADAKENYLDFFLSKEFATDLESLTTKTLSKKNLVALSDCAVFFIPRNSLLELYDVSSCYERLGRKMLEHIVTQQHKLTTVLKTLSPKDKYAFVLENRPELLQQVAIKHLASYLGMARETLSRIRGQR